MTRRLFALLCLLSCSSLSSSLASSSGPPAPAPTLWQTIGNGVFVRSTGVAATVTRVFIGYAG